MTATCCLFRQLNQQNNKGCEGLLRKKADNEEEYFAVPRLIVDLEEVEAGTNYHCKGLLEPRPLLCESLFLYPVLSSSFVKLSLKTKSGIARLSILELLPLQRMNAGPN